MTCTDTKTPTIIPLLIVPNGLTIAAVYIQPVKMEPMLPGMMQQTDIHLEAGKKGGY